MATDVTLKDMKASIDIILQTLQTQKSRQEDDSLLLQSIGSKLDVQNLRIRTIESDVKDIKDCLAIESNRSRNIDESGIKSEEIQQSNQVSGHTIYSLKEEMKEMMSMNTEKIQQFVKDEMNQTNVLHKQNSNVMKEEIISAVKEDSAKVIREEVRQLNEVHTKYATDVISRLDKAEELVFTPMACIAADTKQTVSIIEHLEKGNRKIENSLNEFTQTVCDIKNNVIPKKELKTLLKTVGKTQEQQSNPVTQANLKDELMKKLETLTETNREQTCTLQMIHDEFKPDGKINKIMTNLRGAMIDQLISESTLLRETIMRKRTCRKTYTCDFFLTDFSEFIGSGEYQYSRLWYIDAADEYLKGWARFKKNGTLDISMVRGYASLVVGQTVENGPSVKVMVKAIKDGKQDWNLGDKEMSTNGVNVEPGVDGWLTARGVSVASITCKDLKDKGFIDKRDRVLFRFEITALPIADKVREGKLKRTLTGECKST